MDYNKQLNRSLLTKKYITVMVIFFIVYCLFLSWSFLFQNVDDAYISFRYGKNLMRGFGLVYNAGEYVEGYTNFLWVIITAPFTVIQGIDISVFALIFGLIISLLNISWIYKFIGLFSDVFSNVPVHLLLLPIIFFIVDDSVAFWAIGGMEFPIYTFFILGIIYNYFKLNESPHRLYYMLIFLMLSTMTRPEGNMIFGITIFHMLFYRKNIAKFKSVFLLTIGIYIVFFTVYYGFKNLYYGNFIPNTFYAKGVTDITMNLYLGAKYMAMCIGARIYVFIFILFIPFRKAIKDHRQSYLVFFCTFYIIYLILVGGDWMIANRFFVPLLPLLYLLSAIGLIYAIGKYSSERAQIDIKKVHKVSGALVIGLTITLFTVTIALLEYNQLIIKDENARYEMQWSMFGKWLKQNTDPKTVIAVGPAGKIPYYSELYTIDMWGLNNEYIAKTMSKRLQAGHKKFDFEYVLSLNPEFIIGYAGFKDEDMPAKYQKFNAPEDKYKCFDIVFRLKPAFRDRNK